MRITKWTIGLALIVGGAQVARAENTVQSAFDYQLTSCCEPTCECADPSCCVSDECGDDCSDPCCGDDVCCGSTCGADGCFLMSGWGSPCNDCLGDAWTLDSVILPNSDLNVAGWSQWGYHTDNDGVFNTRPDRFEAQQQYLYLEKVADGSNGVGFGGRADILYGTDAQNTQSFGNPPGSFDFRNGWDHGAYGWAMPQLYGEIASGDLSVKVGHFYTLLGYQVVPATGNFFYSIPYTFNFSEAFTHTGALATYKGFEDVTFYGGWTLGWDTGFDQLGNGNSFLGGATVNMGENVAVTYICTAGDLGWIGEGYSHAIVSTAKLTDTIDYVFQTDYIRVEDSVNAADGGIYDTIGINQYLFYTVNARTKLGARLEWWNADGNSVNEMAYGVNYKPHANVIVRPEIRYNWIPGDNVPFVLTNTGAAPDENYINQTIFGMDVIFTF